MHKLKRNKCSIKFGQKKTEAKKVLTDIIRQLSNRNKNHRQEPKIAATGFYLTIKVKPKPLYVEVGHVRGNQNVNQPNLLNCRNWQN